MRLLSLSMLGMSLLLAGFGAFCFYAFGGETANIIISNLPRGQPLTRATQIAYLFVAVFTVPMCLFPAIRIWERWVFKKQRRSGKKWQKNFLRAAAAVGCLFVGVYGGGELDHLVSLIGGLFSTPLALVFPPLLHLASRADTRPCARAIDAALVGFGVSAGLLATWVAIKSGDRVSSQCFQFFPHTQFYTILNFRFFLYDPVRVGLQYGTVRARFGMRAEALCL